jgi:hypothetical protein
MTAATGMSDGVGQPSVRKLQWHDGKLWIAGRWEAGVDATDFGQRLTNEAWHLWTWSPEGGYEVDLAYKLYAEQMFKPEIEDVILASARRLLE